MFKASDLGRTRTRPLGVESPAIAGDYDAWLFGSHYQHTALGGATLQGLERTVDATHPWWLYFQKNDLNSRRFKQLAFKSPFFRYVIRTGGGFTSEKRYFPTDSLQGRKVSLRSSTSLTSYNTYNGWILPVDPVITTTIPDFTPDLVLESLGAKALLRFKPDRPLVGISQTLAELKREGLPRVRALASFRHYSPRKGGQDYLSWQFGFRPVIQDIYALAESVDTADKQWRTYIEQAAKLVRRHYEYPTEQSTTTTTVALGGTVYPTIPASLASGQNSTLYRTRTIVTKRRFSAAYIYYLPNGSESTHLAVRKALQYKKQYGLDVSPDLLWELTPWSWLIDWFLPIGNYVESVSSLVLGNTVAPWAYISEHSVITDTYERPGVVCKDGGNAGSLTVVYDYKRRIPAHPLGFGINWAGLSPKQLSILAAIGITR